jgi:hypothetical protein
MSKKCISNYKLKNYEKIICGNTSNMTQKLLSNPETEKIHKER